MRSDCKVLAPMSAVDKDDEKRRENHLPMERKKNKILAKADHKQDKVQVNRYKMAEKQVRHAL